MLVGHRPSFPYSHKVYDSPMVAKSLASRITRLQSSQVYNLSYPNPLRVSFLFFFPYCFCILLPSSKHSKVFHIPLSQCLLNLLSVCSPFAAVPRRRKPSYCPWCVVTSVATYTFMVDPPTSARSLANQRRWKCRRSRKSTVASASSNTR